MKCRYSEQEIALYVEQDLNESTLRDIEAHLLECEACGGLAADLRESQSMFKSLRQETVSGAALGEVRFRVLAEVEGVSSTTSWGRRVERWLWAGFRRGYALAGVGLVILVGVGLWYAQGIQHVSMPDPLPPAAAVPLSRGTTAAPEKKIEIEVEVATVPLSEGDSGRRRRTQGVAHTEISEQALAEPDPEPTPKEPKQLVVKLLTDDPNIVIYWIVDQNGNGG